MKNIFNSTRLPAAGREKHEFDGYPQMIIGANPMNQCSIFLLFRKLNLISINCLVNFYKIFYIK